MLYKWRLNELNSAINIPNWPPDWAELFDWHKSTWPHSQLQSFIVLWFHFDPVSNAAHPESPEIVSFPNATRVTNQSQRWNDGTSMREDKDSCMCHIQLQWGTKLLYCRKTCVQFVVVARHLYLCKKRLKIGFSAEGWNQKVSPWEAKGIREDFSFLHFLHNFLSISSLKTLVCRMCSVCFPCTGGKRTHQNKKNSRKNWSGGTQWDKGWSEREREKEREGERNAPPGLLYSCNTDRWSYYPENLTTFFFFHFSSWSSRNPELLLRPEYLNRTPATHTDVWREGKTNV